MTMQQAIQTAKAQGGGFIQMRGERFAFIGKAYPGHSNFVWSVDAAGVADRCR